MSHHAAIRTDITTVFAEDLHLDVPSADTDLIGEGILDSLMFVDLLVQLERRFGLKIPLDQIDLDSFRTIDQIAAFIARRHRSRTAGGDLSEMAGVWAVLNCVGGAL